MYQIGNRSFWVVFLSQIVVVKERVINCIFILYKEKHFFLSTKSKKYVKIWKYLSCLMLSNISIATIMLDSIENGWFFQMCVILFHNKPEPSCY